MLATATTGVHAQTHQQDYVVGNNRRDTLRGNLLLKGIPKEPDLLLRIDNSEPKSFKLRTVHTFQDEGIAYLVYRYWKQGDEEPTYTYAEILVNGRMKLFRDKSYKGKPYCVEMGYYNIVEVTPKSYENQILPRLMQMEAFKERYKNANLRYNDKGQHALLRELLSAYNSLLPK